MHTLIQKATDLATLRSVVHRSSLSHRNHNSKSRIHSSTNIQEADDLIRQSPGSAKGYILMGKLYQQQNKWRAASAVYSAGLRLVNQKTNDDYAQLKREKQYVMGIIAKKHNQQSPPLFPYDILNIIFHSLSTSSLLQCATVCESWFYAIVEWPGFWHRLLNNDDSNQYHSSSSELRIIKYQEQDIQSLLTILLHSECHLVKSISEWINSYNNYCFSFSLTLSFLHMIFIIFFCWRIRAFDFYFC
ncbi:hypothetical protein BDA99DRAFT_525666 [Phascolomyces articulosus]|uniref:F-box domain-containing protein n=1 Tax=Phascolomyces articulosus TaxID=60185 RepID=A0AAD5K231_9FUNG|nr:hypothetical protein BDA99DRAFT_525666 [Phascolomyces articulosus]